LPLNYLKTLPLSLVQLTMFVSLPVNANMLTEMIKESIQSHPSVQTQTANSESSQSSLDAAKWQFYPTPSVSVERASASSTDPTYQGDNQVTVLRLQQPLWTAGRLSGGLDKAEAEYALSLTVIDETKQTLAMQVTQAYGDWMGSYLKLQAAEKSVVSHQHLKEQIHRRLEQGLSPDSDFVLASSRLAQAIADKAVAQTQKAVALAKLSQLLGHKVNEAQLAIIEPYKINKPLDTLIKQALDVNPTKQKLLHAAVASQAEVEVQSSALYPEVYMRAEEQYGNYAYSGIQPTARIFVGLQSNFGAGLSSASKVDAARAKTRASESDLETNQRNITEQIMTEWSNVQNLQARLSALDVAQTSSEEVRASWDRQFVTGRKSWLDVMNAAKELAQTELQIGDSRAGLVVSSWKIAILTQQLNELLAANSAQ
jgi:adhesin transport system outer membrane protein